MTAIVVFAALVIASVVFTIDDNRRMEAARQVDDFYRVEKTRGIRDEMTVAGRI